MHKTMAANPAGILMVRDELTGWLAELDNPGREGERAFCLQAWNGDTPFTLDRIGRGTIHAPHCCMSMLGGITPGRLRAYLADALHDGPTNDGLIQRFQVLTWPDTDPDWTPVNKPVNESAAGAAEAVFRRVLDLDAENPRRLLFDDDAQQLFWEWLTELENKVRSNELHPALISHLAKYRSLMPSLALLGCAADDPERERIPLEDARRGAAWCEYLESHARRVYACVVTPQIRAAHELAQKLQQRKIGASGVFSCREIYFKGWTGLTSPEVVRQAAEILEDAGWIRRSKPEGVRMSGFRSGWLNWESGTRIFSTRPGGGPSKPSQPDPADGFEGFDGGGSGHTQKIGGGPKADRPVDPGALEVGRATALLNRTGTRILPGNVIGVWSDLDSREIRRALELLGMGELPVRYLDGAGVPDRYKLRRVAGEPVPSYVLAQMEQAAEPWAVRAKLLGKNWHFVPWPAPACRAKTTKESQERTHEND